MLTGKVAGRVKVLLCLEGVTAGKCLCFSDPILHLREWEDTSHCPGGDASSSPPGPLAGKSSLAWVHAAGMAVQTLSDSVQVTWLPQAFYSLPVKWGPKHWQALTGH